MANAKITGLPPAGGLAGTESIECVQAGSNRRTTVGDIAALAPGPPSLPLSIGQGGSGETSAQAALDAFFAEVTKGTIIAGDGTHNTPVAVGSDGKVLTADTGAANGLSWQTPAAGGSIGDPVGGGVAGNNLVVGTGPVLAQTTHLESGGVSPTPSYVLGDGGSIASFAGTDSGGNIGAVSGGTGGAGDIVSVVFTTPYTSAPAVAVAAADIRTANLGSYLSAVSTTGFTIAIAGGVPGVTNVSWCYAVIGCPK